MIPQPTEPIDLGPGSAAQPGQGPRYLGPFANQVISDVPSNMDDPVPGRPVHGRLRPGQLPELPAVPQNDHDGDAVAIWTDARNGRGSGAPTSFQAGRNPACEQADMFLDFFNPLREDHTDAVSESEENAFLVTPCPGDDD